MAGTETGRANGNVNPEQVAPIRDQEGKLIGYVLNVTAPHMCVDVDYFDEERRTFVEYKTAKLASHLIGVSRGGCANELGHILATIDYGEIEKRVLACGKQLEISVAGTNLGFRKWLENLLTDEPRVGLTATPERRYAVVETAPKSEPKPVPFWAQDWRNTPKHRRRSK